MWGARHSSTTCAARSMSDSPYWYRPAKRVQRYMMVDAFQHLRAIASPSEYQYVGFGGWEFVDFQLIRRRLGIPLMVSIEKDSFRQKRYDFNRPFKDIDLRFGLCGEVLQELDWTPYSIVWLDYTSKLNHDVLADAAFLAQNLRAGSALAISVQANAAQQEPLEELVDFVGEERIPPGTDNTSLDAWGLADVQRRILLGQLQRHVAGRDDGAQFSQIMYTNYADRSKMMTWVGVLVDDSVRPAFESAAFNRLEQYRPGKRALRLAVPGLSAREVLRLDDLMSAGQRPRLPGVQASDCDSYVDFHRWYPPVPSPL